METSTKPTSTGRARVEGDFILFIVIVVVVVIVMINVVFSIEATVDAISYQSLLPLSS